MAITSIDRSFCNKCYLRQTEKCPVADSCSVDVIRLDSEGKPYIAYREDCHNCFLCSRDCPLGAVNVSAMIVSLTV